jgi:hypothetical protein
VAIVIAGEGEFLAQECLFATAHLIGSAEIHSLERVLGSRHSQGACAFALAHLATERFDAGN